MSEVRRPPVVLAIDAGTTAIKAGRFDLHGDRVARGWQYVPDLGRHAEYAFYVRQYQDTYHQLRELMRTMNEKQVQKRG